MSRTVSPPTQGIIASVTNGLSWARAPGAATAERTGGAPTGGLGTPGRLGSPRKLGFGLVGDRSEQPARIPMLTNVSSPARRYRDIAPSAVGLRLRRTASGQGLVSPRPMTVWLEGNRKGCSDAAVVLRRSSIDGPCSTAGRLYTLGMEWRGGAVRVAATSHLLRRCDCAPAGVRKANVQRSIMIERWTFGFGSWRRPTLPRPRDRSTIGADRLNDRVRDGNGCGPVALVASKLEPSAICCQLSDG